MEWTESARQELESMLSQVRASLDPAEVDIHEVASDIRDRIETELAAGNGHTVTCETLRSAARKIGIQDLLADPVLPDRQKQAFETGMERPRRTRKALATGWFWFTAIILPLVATGTELLARLCLDSGLFDPLPTPFHVILIGLVPLAGYLGWRCLTDRKTLPMRWLGLLLGAATMTALYYTLMFITVTPFAIMGLAAIIFYGIGLICLLPLSPLLSLIALLRLSYRIRRRIGSGIPQFRRGLLLGITGLLLASAPMYLTKLGLRMAASNRPDVQQRGIRLLRWAGDEALMNRACYWGINMPSDPVSWLINRGERTAPDQARDIYYRVTGHAFNVQASPTIGIRSRRNPGDEYDWDPEQGGDVVAGRLKGLALHESRIDGIIEADAATAYLEWTMVFRNDWNTEREARAQIALPPGATVSRLTLWIDGEEREAAFGGRSQVKQAYKDVVVRQRRDPVLVTTYGPDRVLMQCYPVPADGEMKIRIGVTAPLDIRTQTDRTLRLPHLIERNFRIPEHVRHAVWIEDYMISDLTDAQLNAPDARIDATSSVTASWATDGELTVLQEIKSFLPETPEHITIVLDTSIDMKDRFDDIASAMSALPSDVPVTILQAADGDPVGIRPDQIGHIKAAGGKDNAPALRQALTGPADTVIWIHGPQEWDLGSSEMLRQALERSRTKQLFDFQAGSGPNRLIEKMDTLTGYHTVPRYASVKGDLERLFHSFSDQTPLWQATRTATDQSTVPDTWIRADMHLIRLYALDRIRTDLADADPNNDIARDLALKYHLVTPVTGAVVLETQQQYAANDLQPVDIMNVPGVPEPGTMSLLLLAALLLFYGKRITRHMLDRLEITQWPFRIDSWR